MAYADSRGWIGHLVDDPMGRRLQLHIARQQLGRMVAMTGVDGDGVHFSEAMPDGVEIPAFGIPDELGRLLWDLLNQHYGGPGPSRDLRADYVAERARVDKLIDYAVQSDAPIMRTDR